ncbi:hypothetical protein ACPWT1_07955 [Ramlibacter sp. MMS24-I3-19]|uniref:hypothetical protein n=1 Tax=Ramlibacter sp. MMS24-I3-19 TaxID=3416606 RepID=UPI003D0928AA
MRTATRKLLDGFPGIDELRHAVAHAGEFDAHPEDHAPDGLYALTMLGENGRFSAPFRKTVYHLDITAQTLALLEEVVKEFYSGFIPAAKRLDEEGHIE